MRTSLLRSSPHTAPATPVEVEAERVRFAAMAARKRIRENDLQASNILWRRFVTSNWIFVDAIMIKMDVNCALGLGNPAVDCDCSVGSG